MIQYNVQFYLTAQNFELDEYVNGVHYGASLQVLNLTSEVTDLI